MEIHSACDLLDDETDDSVAAYERLAFGRLRKIFQNKIFKLAII